MDTAPGERGPDREGAGRRGDTRARIQQVALELFAEQGYERTSLREIAERLGVTKAALYYHFKSKEDLVRSFTEDYFARVDSLIAWASDQAPTTATRKDILDRYIGIVMDSYEVIRFLEHNQASLRDIEGGKHRFEQMRPRLTTLVRLIAGPEPELRARVRTTAAILAASVSTMFFMRDLPDPDAPGCFGEDADGTQPAGRAALREIVLELADDLTRGLHPAEPARQNLSSHRSDGHLPGPAPRRK
ncbi:MAG: TetR/AcrR family transcriptional regulator [Streptosporangiaceae bacterium]|nr:TetR/AcrR family transcriptional regulator [Streptosporangiaceae bacterium]MBV9856975.1 TetR/AcrR family transcriptional regulator [Streptosporangiaceae bacterium]